MPHRPKPEGGPPGGESLSPETSEIPEPLKEETGKTKEKPKEGIEKKKEEEKEKIQKAFREIFFEAQRLGTDVLIGKIGKVKAKMELKKFIKSLSIIQEYISGKERDIVLNAWDCGWRHLEDEFMSWAMKVFSKEISEGIEQKFLAKKAKELETPEVGRATKIAKKAYEEERDRPKRQRIDEKV